MTGPLPSPDVPRRRFRTRWGIVYFGLVGAASATILFIAVAVPPHSGRAREIALLAAVGILDVLLPVPVALGVFRRRFWRIRRVRALDVVLSLILLAPCLYVVWILVFVVWFGVATIF